MKTHDHEANNVEDSDARGSDSADFGRSYASSLWPLLFAISYSEGFNEWIAAMMTKILVEALKVGFGSYIAETAAGKAMSELKR